MERIERTVLSNLIHNEEYTRRVLPFIKEEYFSDRLEKILFSEIYKFVLSWRKKTGGRGIKKSIQRFGLIFI